MSDEKFNPWKLVKVDVDRLKDNRFVNPKAPEVPQPGSEPESRPEVGLSGSVPKVVVDAKGFITLENIACYGSDGKVFEQYDNLAFAKDVERKQDGSHVFSTPYQAILRFEQQNNGLFLPSYACQTVALVALFNASVRKKPDGTFEVFNPDVERILQQYKDYGPGYGWHNNNTIIDGKGGRIVHYPLKDDFQQHGGTTDINSGRRIGKNFPKNMNRDSSSLEDALKDAVKVRYLQDLTGLKNPRVLFDIAGYFGKSTYFRPADNSVCSAWLGCVINYFNISTISNLGGNSAARGVRREP